MPSQTPPEIGEGTFLKVLFPTSETPRRPGLPHIAYCLAARPPVLLVAYTTSAPWPPEVPLPFGVRLFSAEEAAALNQRKPFRLHLNRLARIALDRNWIPELNEKGRGIVAVAPSTLRQALYELTLELHRRHRDAVQMLGV